MNSGHAAPQFSGHALSKAKKGIQAMKEKLSPNRGRGEKVASEPTSRSSTPEPSLKKAPAHDELIRSVKSKDSK